MAEQAERPRGAGDAGESGDIRAALLTMRRISGLPVAFGGSVLSSGGRHVRIAELSGAATDSLRNLAVISGNGLGGKALALARPLAVTDYGAARSITHEYDAAVAGEGLRAIVAVPVVVRRTIRAMLYGALRQPLPLGDRVVTASVAAARELERSLSRRDEAQRLLSRLDAPPVGTPAWEEVRQIHSELRILTREVADGDLRARLEDVCARLASAGATPAAGPPDRPGAALSPRELDVVACVATGCTNAEAGHRLGLRPETVKSYLRSAMRKLGSHTRLETVIAARRAGLLP